jgi:hypothetical protein
MIVSSGLGSGLWRGRCEGPAVAQQCPQDVDQAPGQREQGLGVDESFAAFLVVDLNEWSGVQNDGSAILLDPPAATNHQPHPTALGIQGTNPRQTSTLGTYHPG